MEKYYDMTYLTNRIKELMHVLNFIESEINNILYEREETEKNNDNNGSTGEDKKKSFLDYYYGDKKNPVEEWIDRYVEENRCLNEDNANVYQPGWILQGFSDDGKGLVFYLVFDDKSVSAEYLEKTKEKIGIDRCRYLDGFEECPVSRKFSRKCCRQVVIPLSVLDEGKRSRILYFQPMERYVKNKLRECYRYIQTHTSYDPDLIMETIFSTM